MLKTEPSGFPIFNSDFAKRREEKNASLHFEFVFLQMSIQVPRQLENRAQFHK